MGTVDVDFYATPGPFTSLTSEQKAKIRDLALGPIDLCRTAQRLLVSPQDAANVGLDTQRLDERNIRPASILLQRALELAATPLSEPRPAQRQVVGTCRHFAVLATALLIASDIPARARCGFATYFVPPKKVDHWIIEYWGDEQQRWIRIDPEYLDRATPTPCNPSDLRPGEFLTAGEAWQLLRSGKHDAADFGVFGTDNWGPGEVRGNAMRDLASVLHKIEMLPWDEWGPMTDSYENKTGDEFDALIDDLAIATHDEDDAAMERIYEPLAVPTSMIG